MIGVVSGVFDTNYDGRSSSSFSAYLQRSVWKLEKHTYNRPDLLKTI